MSTEDSKLKRNFSLRIASKMFPKYISTSRPKGKQKCTKSFSAMSLRHTNGRKIKLSTKDRNLDTQSNTWKRSFHRSLSHRFPSFRKRKESHIEEKPVKNTDNNIHGVNIGNIGLRGELSKSFRKTLFRKYKSVTAFHRSKSSSDVKCEGQSKLNKVAPKKQHLSSHFRMSKQGLSIQLKSRLNSIPESVDLSGVAIPRQIQTLKSEAYGITKGKPITGDVSHLALPVRKESFIESPTCADPFGIDEEEGHFMFETPLRGTESVPNIITHMHIDSTPVIHDTQDHTDRVKLKTNRNPLQRRSVGLMDLCRKEEEYENPWVLQKETPGHNLKLSLPISAQNGWDITDNFKQTCFASEVIATSPGYDSFGFVVNDMNEKSIGSLRRTSSHDSIDSFSSSVHSVQSQELFFSDSEAEVNVDQISISSADSGTFENQLSSDKSFEFDVPKERTQNGQVSAKKEITKVTPKVKVRRKNGISLEEGGDIAGKIARKLFGKQVSMETAIKTRKKVEKKEKDETLKRRSLDSNLKIKQMTLDLESMTDSTLKWVGSSDSGLSSALSPVFEVRTTEHEKSNTSKASDLDESKKYYTLPNPRKSRAKASTPKMKMSLESISKKLSEKAQSLSNLKLSSSFKLRNIKNEDSKLNNFLKTNSWTNLVVKKGAEVASNFSTLIRKRSNSNSASNSPFLPRTSRVKTDNEREKEFVYEKVKLYASRKTPISTVEILKWKKRLKLNIEIAQGREQNSGIRNRADSYIARHRSSSSLSPINSPTLLDEIMKSVERVRFINFRESLLTDCDLSDGEDSSCCSSPPIFTGISNDINVKSSDSVYTANEFISMCQHCRRIQNCVNDKDKPTVRKSCQKQKLSLSLCDLNNVCQCSKSVKNRLKLPRSDIFNITTSDKNIKRSESNRLHNCMDAESLFLSSTSPCKSRRPVSMLDLRNMEDVLDSPEDEVDFQPGALFRHLPRHNLSDDNLDNHNVGSDAWQSDINSPSYEDLIHKKCSSSGLTSPITPVELLSPESETYHSCSELMDTEISVASVPSTTQTDYKKSHSCGNLVDDVDVFVENKLKDDQDTLSSKEVRKAKVKSLSSSHDALNTFVHLDKLNISKDNVTACEISTNDIVAKERGDATKQSEKEILDNEIYVENIAETAEICDSQCDTCDELPKWSETDNRTIGDQISEETCAKCEKLRNQAKKKTGSLKYHKSFSVSDANYIYRNNQTDIGKPPIPKSMINRKANSLDDMMGPETVFNIEPNQIERYSEISSSSRDSYRSSPVLSPVTIEIQPDLDIKETCCSAPSTPFIKSHRKNMFDFNENDVDKYTQNTLAPPNLGRLKSVSSENMNSAKTPSPKTRSWTGGLRHTCSHDAFSQNRDHTVPNLLGKLGHSKSSEFTESCPLSVFPDVPGPDVMTMYKYDVGLGYLLHSIECGNQTICFYSFQRNKQLMESVITPLAALPGVTGTKPGEAVNADKSAKVTTKVRTDTHSNPAAPITNIPSEKLSHAGRVIRTVLLTRASHMIRDRKFHLRTYRRCMVGTEMVDWLIQQSPLVHSRTQAIGMWQALVEEGVVVHVCHEHQFKDKYLFYRFHEDDEGVSTVPTTVTKRESEEELQEVFLMLAQIGPDAMMRMILRKPPHERTMEDLEIIYEELLHIKALSHLSTMVKRELASVLVFESHAKAGTVLFNQGDEGKSWYIILKGSVNVVIYGKGVVCTLHEGDDFGKLALVNDAPRAATIVLRDDNCHFLRVDKDDFNRILRDVEANTVRLKEHGQDVLVLEKIPSNSQSADGTVHTHYKYSVMAGTPEKMLEYLLETRLEGKKEDEIDGFLEDFLLTHVIFMPNNHLCPVLLSHYHSSMADTNEQEAYEISLNHKKCVLHFVKEWANTVGMAFRADQTINAFLQELHSCILEDLSVYTTLKEDVVALETILHAQSDSPESKLKRKASSNATLSRKHSKENQNDVVSKVKPVKPSAETIFKVYCADHTYSTLKLPMDTSVEKLLYSTKEKLGLGDDLILCEVKSTGERIVFKENDLCVISGLSINGRLFITPKEHLDALTPIPEQEGPQEGTFSAIELISSREMAFYMTTYDWELFTCVQEYELIYQVFGRYKFGKITANLDLFLRRFNEIQYWVVTEMVLTTNLSKRVSLLRKFIKIASHCKEFQNLNSFFAIVMGLSNIAVSRLSQTWEKLPSKFKKLFAEFETLMDPSRNHRVYRLSVAKMAPPIIPFMPLLMKDMTFTHEGNKTYFDGLVNFEKMHMISQTLKTVRFCRSSNLDLEMPGSFKSTDAAGYIRTLNVIDNQRRLTQFSHQVEPRKS